MLLPRETADNLRPRSLRVWRRDGCRRLERREESPSSQGAIIAVVSVVIVVSIAILLYVLLRSLRKRHSSSKYIPTKALKRRWEAWDPAGKRALKHSSAQSAQRNSSAPTLLGRDGQRSNRTSRLDLELGGQSGDGNDTEAEVERHESVRSVMTLPTYSKSVRENERILGREGDRDGIDVVIEAPETEEMEEERREEEMESLYQIRVQRRREIAEREERRTQRREARERGDFVALNRLRQESRVRAEESTLTQAAAMIAEHQSRERGRRVSSVSYTGVGLARHDGSRVRADSQESHRGLLSDAASIGGASMRPWNTRDSLSVHHRDLSGSVLSLSDADSGSDFETVAPAPPFGRAGNDFEVVNLHQTQTHSRNTSRQLTPAGGTRSRASSASTNGPPPIDTSALEGQEPPSYSATGGFEDAPPYTSPVRERAPAPEVQQRPQQQRQRQESAFSPSGAPLLPGIERLPTIRIGNPTPAEHG